MINLSTGEAIFVILSLPFVSALAIWCGRKFQWWYWDMHLPYDERAKAIRDRK